MTMSTQSQSQELVASGAAKTQSTFEVERLDPPTPGSYWRLLVDIKKAIRSRRQVSPPMDAGVVLMLLSIESADGGDHAYHFASHPLMENDPTIIFHADDFNTFWERVGDGPAIRSAEMAAVLSNMDQTRLKMMQAPPDDSPAGLLGTDGADLGAPGQALVTPDQIRDMTYIAERMQAQAKRQAQWISTHSKALSEQAGALVRFQEEQAQAVIARTEFQLESLKGLLKTVDNLKRYTGEGVGLMQLLDGEPAPASEPLHIYQDVLAFDEETGILLDKGGMDHRHIDSLRIALQDPAILERIVPQPRSITLVRFRNTYKEFAAGDDIGTNTYNASMNKVSTRNRLLVRDGCRLHLIDVHDEMLESINQLLPSTSEQAGYFDAHDNDAPYITRDDLTYARARREQLNALDAYGKVLILLWGLRDRGELFAESHIPLFGNWLDPDFQGRYLRLVSLDSMITEDRPSFNSWQATQNDYLSPGCYVVVNFGEFFNAKNCPGAFSEHGTIYEPQDKHASHAFARVRAERGDLVIDIACNYAGWNDAAGRTRNIKGVVRRRGRVAEGVLVLDRIRANELDYYLTSRKQRRSYSQFLELFRGAKAWITERDEREAPERAALRTAITDGGLKVDPRKLDDAITDALAITRTSRRDGVIPEAGSKGYALFRRRALDVLHASVVDGSERTLLVEQWAKNTGREPLRLVFEPKAGWGLYVAPITAEHDARLGRITHVTRFDVDFKDAQMVVQSEPVRTMLHAVAGEQVMHDWICQKGDTDWKALKPAFQCTYDQAIAVCDRLKALSEEASQSLTKPSKDELLRIIDASRRFMRNAKGRLVERMKITVPIGVAMRHGYDSSRTAFILLAHADALRLVYALGDDEIRRLAVEASRERYRNKEYGEKAVTSGTIWTQVATSFQSGRQHIEGYLEWHPELSGLNIDRLRRESTKDSAHTGDAVNLYITEMGAKLFPELSDKCMGPL